jgi:hypothetical protein
MKANRPTIQGVHPNLMVDDRRNSFRCYPCGRFQPPGLAVMVPSVMHDTRHRRDEVEALGPPGWNREYTAWCVECARIISKPRSPQGAMGWLRSAWTWLAGHG